MRSRKIRRWNDRIASAGDRAFWQFFEKLNIHWLYNSGILISRYLLKKIKTHVHTKPLTQMSVVQLLRLVPLFAPSWNATCQTSLSITNSQSVLKLMSIELMMLSNYLILCCPLLLLHWIFPSIRVFSNESVLCIRWQKYWGFSLSISTSDEYSRLISFRMDWLDLLAVQGTLKSFLQDHSLKASIL